MTSYKKASIIHYRTYARISDRFSPMPSDVSDHVGGLTIDNVKESLIFQYAKKLHVSGDWIR
jgi:hypothetical protein